MLVALCRLLRVGRHLQRLFELRKRGCVLCDADTSQVELQLCDYYTAARPKHRLALRILFHRSLHALLWIHELHRPIHDIRPVNNLYLKCSSSSRHAARTKVARSLTEQ